MINFLLIFTIVFSFISHSSYAKSQPKWTLDLTKEKDCKRKNLCAVGVGPSVNSAKRDARAGIAKVFDTKIISKFTSKLSDRGEVATEEFEESVNSALSGIKIIKTYEGKMDVYALAVINKAKASRGFKTEIKKLDNKMKILSSHNGIKSGKDLEKYYMQRELLDKKYQFLTGFSIPEVVRYDQIFKKKKEMGNVIIHVYIDEAEPKEIEAVLSKLLSDQGMKVTTGSVRNRKSTHVVTGSLVADKQYMKIKGFEKYKFVFKVSSGSIREIISGVLNFSFVTTGRNYSQNYIKALLRIKEYLNENIDKLNLE